MEKKLCGIISRFVFGSYYGVDDRDSVDERLFERDASSVRLQLSDIIQSESISAQTGYLAVYPGLGGCAFVPVPFGAILFVLLLYDPKTRYGVPDDRFDPVLPARTALHEEIFPAFSDRQFLVDEVSFLCDGRCVCSSQNPIVV